MPVNSDIQADNIHANHVRLGHKIYIVATDQNQITLSINGNITVASVQANGDVRIGHTIITNIFQIDDWKKLTKAEQNIRQRIQAYPDDYSFYEELEENLEQQKVFKQRVLQLAVDFQHIAVNSERIYLAQAAFEEGDFNKARQVLKSSDAMQEYNELLYRMDSLKAQTIKIEEQLGKKATEFTFLAKLLALDFELRGDRFPQANEAYCQALAINRNLENLFEYAKFLSSEGSNDLALKHYLEALELFKNPTINDYFSSKLYLAKIHHNIALILSENPQKFRESRIHYYKALRVFRVLSKRNPITFSYYKALTFFNLSELIKETDHTLNKTKFFIFKSLQAIDSIEYPENNQFDQKTLSLIDTYKKHFNNLEDFLSKKSNKNNVYLYLKNLQSLLKILSLSETNRLEIIDLYKGFIKLFDKFKNHSFLLNKYYLNEIMNSLAVFLADYLDEQHEAEYLYKKILSIYQSYEGSDKIIEDKNKYNISQTLNNLANLLRLDKSRHEEVEQYYQEALSIVRSLSVYNKAINQVPLAGYFNNLASLLSDYSFRQDEAEEYYRKSLNIYIKLSKNNYSAFTPYIAMVEHNLGNLLSLNADRQTEAESFYRKSLSIRYDLYKISPKIYASNLADTLNSYANLLSKNKFRHDEASNMYSYSLEIRRELFNSEPNKHIGSLGSLLFTFGHHNLLNKKYKKAIIYLEESFYIFQSIHEDNPNLHVEQYTNVKNLLNYCYQKTRHNPRYILTRLLDYFR